MPDVSAKLGADPTVGDVIQCDGDTVPADLRDKYFIVRALEPDIELSWPYVDAGCTVLYVPYDPLTQTRRDWRAHAESIERREKKANAALGLTLKERSWGDRDPLVRLR